LSQALRLAAAAIARAGAAIRSSGRRDAKFTRHEATLAHCDPDFRQEQSNARRHLR
jgi:hypothetical protein